MASILKITDGTTEVDFISDSAYRLTDWSPAVAARRQNTLGGRGPYEDVIEEMRLFIGGSSALYKLEMLQYLMLQAERWSNGERVNPVNLHIKATASSSEMNAVIYGPPSAGDEMVILPGNFADAAVLQAIDPVILRFRRSGLWLTTAEDSAGSSGSASNPTTATALLTGSHTAYSPYELGVSSFPWREDIIRNSFILLTSSGTTTNAAKKLVIIEAELMDTDVSVYAYTETGYKARGNSVLRFNFGTAGTITCSAEDISALVDTGVRRWSVFAACRSNSVSASFQVYADLRTGNRVASTPGTAVPAGYNSNKPFWMYLGQVSLREELQFLTLTVVSDAAGTIDFDSIAMLAADDPLSDKAIAITSNGAPFAGASFSAARSFYIEHRLGEAVTPRMYFVNNTDLLYQDYSGDLLCFAGPGQPAIAMAWLACGQYDDTYWRATDSAGAVVATSFNVVRKKGQTTIT